MKISHCSVPIACRITLAMAPSASSARGALTVSAPSVARRSISSARWRAISVSCRRHSSNCAATTPVTRNAISTSQSSGSAMTSVLYGGTKSQSRARKAPPASEMPSARPAAELPPSTMRRKASTTCALSRRVRTVHISAPTTSSTPNQMSHWRNCRRGAVMAALLSELEAIPHRGLGPDETWAHRIHLELAPQLANVDAEVLLRVARRRAPHRAEELRVRERLARMRDEHAQQIPLRRCEVHLDARALHRAPREIDHEVVHRHECIVVRTGGMRRGACLLYTS